ncbi:MAG TPA: OsmC family peroxiredoxin [Bdellovibrionales bacterium]|nr:OsmC family peroxiredoxin [Bdellovibrionales bacterium]
MDAFPEFGGDDLGPTPKELLLNAVMGCTGMDVISILTKMRQTPTAFSIKALAEKTKEAPTHFPRIDLRYELTGEIEAEKLLKAVTSSMTKYCGVSFMVAKRVPIFYDVYLNDKKVGEGQAFPG